MDSAPGYVRTRLSVMFFLQFFIWASWFVPIGGYGPMVLHLKGWQMAWIYSSTALGAIISPLFIGYVADRLFATERVLCVLHLIGGVCLCLAAGQTGENAFGPLIALLMINALCFMPTLALANALAFRNIPDPEKFPRIAVLGTIGWIVSGLTVEFVLGGAAEKWFFYLAGAAGILMGLYCLTLPHTPPKGRDEAGGDVLGFGSLRLLKDASFLMFVVCAFLITIPAVFYFQVCNPFLAQTDRPVPTALMTLSQFSEIFVMFTMPWFIARLGLRKVLALGMLAWAVRYFCFASPSFPLVLLGLLVHGFCYCFVFVGAYIYIDKKAPRDLRASAQSFIAFLMLGVGWIIGAQVAGFTTDRYPGLVTNMRATRQTDEGVQKKADAPLPAWADPEAGKSIWQYLGLSGAIQGRGPGTKPPRNLGDALAKKLDADNDGRITLEEFDKIPDDGIKIGDKLYTATDVRRKALSPALDADGDGRILANLARLPDEGLQMGEKTFDKKLVVRLFATADLAELLDCNNDGRITAAELEQVPAAGLTLGDYTYARRDLIEVFTQVSGSQEVRTRADFLVTMMDGVSVTRPDWREAQSNRWPPIWLWPAGAATLICAFFWLGSRDTETEEEQPKEEKQGREKESAEGTENQDPTPGD